MINIKFDKETCKKIGRILVMNNIALYNAMRNTINEYAKQEEEEAKKRCRLSAEGRMMTHTERAVK